MLHACYPSQAAFKLWLLPHLIAALLPLLFAFIYSKQGRLSVRDVLGIEAILVGICWYTSEGWLMVYENKAYEGCLRFWLERCSISTAVVYGLSLVLTSLFFTWRHFRRQSLKKIKFEHPGRG